MSKLKQIEQALRENPNIEVGHVEISSRPYHRGHPGEYKVSVHIPVWPKEPLAGVNELQRFMLEQVKASIPATPFNVCHCYAYMSMSKPYVKMGALFYDEPLDRVGEYGERERWITVSVHPCAEIAKTKMIREVIPLRAYECGERCPIAKKCVYRVRRQMLPFGR